MASPPIQLSGLASGLDTDSVINALTALERAPRARMTMRQAGLQARQKALGDIAGRLRSLVDAAQALGSTTTWKDAQTVTSADASKVAARQLTVAAPGGYSIAVTRLATAEQRSYAYTPPDADDTLTIGSGSVTIAAGASVTDAARAINADQTLGVMAIDLPATDTTPASLILVARATGTAGAFTASGASIVEDPARARPARDAEYSINGEPPATSSSNVVKDAIPGVELTLLSTTAGTGVSVSSPKLDGGSASGAVQSFVNAYNAAVDALRAAVSERPVANPKTNSEASRGSLYGDPALKAILDRLRQTVGQSFTDPDHPGDPSRLLDIGVSTGAATGAKSSDASIAGKLTIDTKALTASLDTGDAGVRRLLGGSSGGGGVSGAIQSLLRPYAQAGGMLDQSAGAAGTAARAIDSDLAAFDRRIAQHQSQLRTQFTSMETALARSHAQALDLAQRLSGLSSYRGQ